MRRSLYFQHSLTLLTFSSISFFFSATATSEIYTLSLHDALPILDELLGSDDVDAIVVCTRTADHADHAVRVLEAGKHLDRKSTRLNSSHPSISYAVFCLKKKKRNRATHTR